MPPRRQLIRHVACSYDGRFAVVAEFEKFVQVWDLVSGLRVAAFETTLGFGGRRLAMSRDGSHIAVGSFDVHGVALYDAKSGQEIWRRMERTDVQSIRFSNDDRKVLCGFEEDSYKSIDRAKGKVTATSGHARVLIESVFDESVVFVLRDADPILYNPDGERIDLPRKTFAVLGLAFSPDAVCISESGGTIRCFDSKNGEELWEHDPGDGKHALQLAYNEAEKVFVAVAWPYAKGGPHEILNFDPSTGAVKPVVSIEVASAFDFCFRGTRILTSEGKLYDTAAGSIEKEFTFFNKT